MNRLLIILLLWYMPTIVLPQSKTLQQASAPLYRDPIYDGAADPTVVWNYSEKSWWMLYTSRRANVESTGVAYCFGTSIAVASSSDNGKTWVYRGALKLDIEEGMNTFWAPEVICENGTYHLYVTYIQGVRSTWGGNASILHYTSTDMWKWTYQGKLLLSSGGVIDPAIIKTSDGKFKMWYKDDANGALIMTAGSNDLYTWKDGKKPVFLHKSEGPIVFSWHGFNWLLTDEWQGMRVYRSKNWEDWERQGLILNKPSSRREDGPSGAHGNVLVTGDSTACIFYFTHPGRSSHTDDMANDQGVIPYASRRSSIQVASLVFKNGTLDTNRDSFDFYLPDKKIDRPALIRKKFKNP